MGMADAIVYTLPEKERLFERLKGSPFRSGFHLSDKDRAYIARVGIGKIRSHAEDFVRNRLSAENPENDGKQTPLRGHPVFIAQHAAACCCRSCLEKWHNIPSGKVLTQQEQDYIVDILIEWINRELARDKQ